jgi:hypothetical protein
MYSQVLQLVLLENRGMTHDIPVTVILSHVLQHNLRFVLPDYDIRVGPAAGGGELCSPLSWAQRIKHAAGQAMYGFRRRVLADC